MAVRSRGRQIVVRAAWVGTGLLAATAAMTGLNLSAGVGPWATVWLARGTLRLERGGGVPGWRGHPAEIRVFHGAGVGQGLEVGALPLAGLAMAGVVVAMVARRERQVAGACGECGYDQRGLPATIGLCPECGKATLK